ncbi:MAG TPA: flagellar hook-associated protein FlgK [Candidatus Aquilonibacter sp.]|nr:flagellar hook-associated protein FlgK [Candidatus Aquilonibacter sp.]
MSLTSGLYAALSALQADQGALAVVSNNISNVNTPGYSREIANLDEAPPVSYDNLQFGTGTNLSSIQGVRDNVLLLRLNQETQTQSQLNTFVNGLNQIQPLFNDSNGGGLESYLSQFFNSFLQLSSDPTNAGYRQGVIEAGQNLASAVNQAANGLLTQQQDADQSVTQAVAQVNSLTGQIASLNQQISSLQGGGQTPNTLIDQRNELINQLSQIIDVRTISADQGSLTLTTAGGAALVVGNQSFQLTTQINLATGFQDVNSQGADITSTIQSGSLGGDLQLRDQEIPSILNNLNTLAYDVANSVNSQSAVGYDLNGNPGGNFFTPPASLSTAALDLSVSVSDPNLIAASSDGTPGNSDNATALANLADQTVVNGETPVNFYSAIVSQVGNDTSNASSALTSQNLLVQQIQDQVGSVSGVSLDEEGANLIQYQNAYDAAARVASVVASLFQVAINVGSTS